MLLISATCHPPSFASTSHKPFRSHHLRASSPVRAHECLIECLAPILSHRHRWAPGICQTLTDYNPQGPLELGFPLTSQQVKLLNFLSSGAHQEPGLPACLPAYVHLREAPTPTPRARSRFVLRLEQSELRLACLSQHVFPVSFGRTKIDTWVVGNQILVASKAGGRQRSLKISILVWQHKGFFTSPGRWEETDRPVPGPPAAVPPRAPPRCRGRGPNPGPSAGPACTSLWFGSVWLGETQKLFLPLGPSRLGPAQFPKQKVIWSSVLWIGGGLS